MGFIVYIATGELLFVNLMYFLIFVYYMGRGRGSTGLFLMLSFLLLTPGYKRYLMTVGGCCSWFYCYLTTLVDFFFEFFDFFCTNDFGPH